MSNNAKISLTGRLVRAPKQSTYNNTTVISFTMAVYTTKKVNDKYVSDFYNVSYWGKPAETIFPKLAQGTMVVVHGDVYQEEYTSNKTGEKGLGMSVRATDIIKVKDPEGKGSAAKAAEEDPWD